MSTHNRFSADDLLLYLVTDTELSAPHSVAEVVEAAVAGGVTMVQVRSKTVGGRDLLDLTCQVARRVGHRVPVLVDDRVDVYLAARNRGEAVAGVHVGQSDLPVRDVRAICGPEAVVGLSAATPEEFVALDQQLPTGLVNYAGIGAVHATQTKPDHPEPLGVEGFARARSLCSVPAVAIGGVKVQDITPLMEAGADGLAVVSGICAADDPQEAARSYREVIGR
ncbi:MULTISPECIES: thiamine phosphate synthase [Kocuria]|uniref:thiamine phosphate synthase n=1 Tax=Kocuria TaxID=57493 RepID=UPI001E6342EF|nr:thiamine phosphate synthase [Kocuria sp. CPCC 104605]